MNFIFSDNVRILCLSCNVKKVGKLVRFKQKGQKQASFLQLIYTKSLDTGEVPADWRTANVSPVYKKGLKSAAENYRPISLTSVCCKILEHIIARNIMQHAERKTFYIHYNMDFEKAVHVRYSSLNL